MQGATRRRPTAMTRPSLRLVKVAARSRIGRIALVNLILFGAVALIGEVAFRLFWRPTYWVSCDRWLVGSGQTRAGRKWWPETDYLLQSPEFRAHFRTNSQGYRARSAPPRTARPYRISFVGDSFTEAMQVPSSQSFVDRIEVGLAGVIPGREVICENFGIAATGPFEYWERTYHDVLGTDPPDALVLCLFPGNDFTEPTPADGFDRDGRPRLDYFSEPGVAWHVLTWLNLKSKFAHYLQRSALIAFSKLKGAPDFGPWMWWSDPALAVREADDPAIRRVRAIFRAIDEACRRTRTRLIILVVGPTPIYQASNGASPIGQIIASWGIAAPVIDASLAMGPWPESRRWVFPRDGHLNDTGHQFVAAYATPKLAEWLRLERGRRAR
jgi:hypothetical protein